MVYLVRYTGYYSGVCFITRIMYLYACWAIKMKIVIEVCNSILFYYNDNDKFKGQIECIEKSQVFEVVSFYIQMNKVKRT